MDIQNLKEECNLLIDTVIKLQEQENELDRQIKELEEQLFSVKKEDASAELKRPEELQVPEKEESPEKSAASTALKLPEEEKAFDEPEFPQDKEDSDAPEKADKPVEITETLKGESAAEPENEEPPPGPAAEMSLRNQAALLSEAAGRGKDILIVYERPDRLQKLVDVLKTLLFIVLMIFIVAAAVLLLYFGIENGVM